MSKYTIGLIGLWHLGEIFSSGLAEIGHTVIGISDDATVVENLKKDVPPLPEPQLADLLKKNREAGRLTYTTDFSELKKCNVVWIAFDTPVDNNDEADLSVVYQAIDKAIPYLQNGVLFVMTSQMPVGTSEEVKRRIKGSRPDLNFEYVYTPENLRLGEAIKCFMEPVRIVVGTESESAFSKISEIFSPLKAEILKMLPPSAEMAKHALNAFLATSISFINDIADVCENTGADILEVVRALRSDPRIGPKAFLDPGLGFSGGTLGRDLKALSAISKKIGVEPYVIESVYKKNLSRKGVVKDRLEKALGGVKEKTVAIFGLTYKAGTKTLRRSRALEIAKELSDIGALVHLHDPYAEKEELPPITKGKFSKDPYEAAKGASAIILMTPWPEFKDLDFKKLRSVTATPCFFLDTSNFFRGRENEIRAAGFMYQGIGRK